MEVRSLEELQGRLSEITKQISEIDGEILHCNNLKKVYKGPQGSDHRAELRAQVDTHKAAREKLVPEQKYLEREVKRRAQ